MVRIKYDPKNISQIFRPAFEACGVKVHKWYELYHKVNYSCYPDSDQGSFTEIVIFVGLLTVNGKTGWWIRDVENHPCGCCAPGRFFSGVDKYMNRLDNNPKLGSRFYRKCTTRGVPKSTLQDFTNYYLHKGIVDNIPKSSLLKDVVNYLKKEQRCCEECGGIIVGKMWLLGMDYYCHNCHPNGAKLHSVIELNPHFRSKRKIKRMLRKELPPITYSWLKL